MKKVLSLVLVAILALGMASVAFASGTTTYTYTPNDQDENLSVGYSIGSRTNVTERYGDIIDLGDVRPYDEQEEYIYLYVDMFSWERSDGTIISGSNFIDEYNTNSGATTTMSRRTLTSSEIRKLKLNVRTKVSSGSRAIDEVKVVNSKGRIEVIFVDEYVSTNELDFEFTVYLTVDGKRRDDYGLIFMGTLENPVTDVYADDDYVDTSDGTVAEAQEFVSNIEVDLGNGVSIFTKLFKGKSYYGTASREDDDAADVVYSQYPDVDNVVIMKTVGLNSTGDIVKLDTDYDAYYVYDADMNYLGTSTEMLPYSTRYYLANRKLDIADDVDEIEAPVTDIDNPDSGGDDVYESNVNDNPGTGA